MKTENKPNRRFCDVGDLFYLNKESLGLKVEPSLWILKCSRYYKSHYSKYEFDVFRGGEENVRILKRTFYRDDLDVLWKKGRLYNLTENDRAKEILLGNDI